MPFAPGKALIKCCLCRIFAFNLTFNHAICLARINLAAIYKALSNNKN